MNIIDAWKKAKEGEIISRGNGNLLKGKDESLESLIRRYDFNDSMLLADDWEVERKPLVWEGKVKWSNVYDMPIPHNEDGYYKEFKQFIGKRTKIRIEEILD